MDVEIKIKEDMKKLGCNCDKKIALACHLYIYLVDGQLMYDTEYCYNKDIDVIYVVARPMKSEKLNIYVPIPTCFDVSMKFVNTLQDNLCTVETGPSITLALIESDFTIVMYTFIKGLAGRQPAEKASQIRQKQEKRSFINSELKKNKNDIINAATNGGLVDDDDVCDVLN